MRMRLAKGFDSLPSLRNTQRGFLEIFEDFTQIHTSMAHALESDESVGHRAGKVPARSRLCGGCF